MNNIIPHTLFTEFDIALFKSGNHYKLYEKFGAHLITKEKVDGVYFAVFAPAASKVEVIGDFNYWQGDSHILHVRYDSSGIWEGFLPNVKKGALYKYKITNIDTAVVYEKADPFAFYCERPPRTASIVWNYGITNAKVDTISNNHNGPMSIYEVHLPSWKRPWDDRAYMSYKEIGEHLIPYLLDLGFTHVEFMPIMEYPYDPSWGYQVTGYFAPTSRMGTPQDFSDLISEIRKVGIGVILDWVPSHFPEDSHGLGLFDGSHVYEHPDRKKGFHPDWKSLIFNYGRPEVKSFLISNALFWYDVYQIDALRVDAVASMLYLDYSREEGEWEPNEFGGNENLDAIAFLKDLNIAVYQHFPNAQMIAEESTSFNGVTKPVYDGGLGFGYKWMMGWMNDTLNYFKKDPIHRRFHQNEITFSLVYAFSENFVLPLSHDEVVHGKGSLLSRMPGDEWQKFANLRILYSLMYTHPGSKLLFMGSEFAQSSEWHHNEQLDWELLQYHNHRGIYEVIKSLNHLYSSLAGLHTLNYTPDGFEWIDYADHANSIISFMRKANDPVDDVVVVVNFTPTAHADYRIGVSHTGTWIEVFNSDADIYGGSSYCKSYTISAENIPLHQKSASMCIEIPPLGVRIFKRSN